MLRVATSFIASAFVDSAAEILENLSRWNVILGIVLMVFALVTVFCANPIMETKKNWTQERRDKAAFILKICALALVVIGALLACF